jgi:hypothetical protein
MSFPQPNSEAYVTGGEDCFRLRTALSSPGDMYESLVSGLGMALGPESDIANVNVAYFDAQAPNFMQFTQVSPSRSFVGRIDANNTGKYAPAQRPGRVLIWPGDLYDPNYQPRGFGVNDAIQFISPVLDVVQYFSTPGTLTPARTDKEYQFQNYLLVGTLFIVVPYYGRKYCYVQFTNRNSTDPNTFGIRGVNYAITNDGSANPYHQETTIRAAAAVAAGASVTVRVTAGSTGMFDALVFSVNNNGPAPLRIVVSDESQGT